MALQKVAQQRSVQVFTTQELYEVAQSIKLVVPNFEDFIESLNVNNFLLKKGPRLYKLMC